MLIRRIFLPFVIFSLLAASCAPSPVKDSSEPDPFMGTEIPLLLPPNTPHPDDVDVSIPTPTLDDVPRQAVIYDNGRNILSIDPATGESRVLISRDELESLLPPDRSADSYTYGYKKPVEIDLAPDLSQARITLCASLDVRFRCVFENYIYTLESKNLKRLPLPSGAYGVYWQWSLDGSTLAGAGWTHNNTDYLLTRFYAVQSGGTEFQTPDLVNNGHWQIAWHPGGRVILPLTFITNFRSIFVDGSDSVDISIPELAWNDKMECLSFSPDFAKVAFVIRGELPKNRDHLYVARSDFADPVLLTEYNMDARYTCEIGWSPDQSFVSIGYVHEPGVETGQERSKELVPLGKVVQIDNGSLSELPTNSRVCLWSPDGALLYEKAGFAGEAGRIEAFSVPDTDVVNLPDVFKTSMSHCPLRWLDEAPALDIPEGIPVDSACRPGKTYKDEINPTVSEISPLFDLIEVTSILDGETLEVFMTLDVMTDNLSAYLTNGVTQYFNGWEVLVDIDNNLLTGDRLGVEYRFSVVVQHPIGGNPAALGSAILKFDPVVNNYVRADVLALAFRADDRILAVKGTIPGINENSRLIFLSRMAKGNSNANPNFDGDRICD